MRLQKRTKSATSRVKNHLSHYRLIDFVTLLLVVFAAALLVTVVVTYVIATQTKLSSYRTPIPLAQKEYNTGDMIQGYFDGRKIYDGRVIIERQLSCNDGYIEPLVNYRDGSKTVKSILPARTINDVEPRNIAYVPEDVSAGATCFVVFRHTACVPYLFDCYGVEYSYVSLPFIVKDEPKKDKQKTKIPENSLPSDDKGLSPPPVNSNDRSSTNQGSPPVSQTTPVLPPQSPPPATVPAPEPSDDIPRRNDLQRILRGVNNTIKKIPLVGGIIEIEEE